MQRCSRALDTCHRIRGPRQFIVAKLQISNRRTLYNMSSSRRRVDDPDDESDWSEEELDRAKLLKLVRGVGRRAAQSGPELQTPKVTETHDIAT